METPNETPTKPPEKSKTQELKKLHESDFTGRKYGRIPYKQKNGERLPPVRNEDHVPGKKRIRTYLFEFLMLFLAVFCGFIADSYREKLSERQREKQFIKSIVEDIKSDTLQSDLILRRLKSINEGIDSVLIILSLPETVKNSNALYELWTKNLGLDVFVSNDRTIEQLKNSGDLRLIRNKAVSDGIMKYDQTLKKYYAQSNLMYSVLGDQTYYSQLFDFISLKNNPNIPVPLTEQGKESLNQAYANLQIWNKGLVGLIRWLEVVNEEGTLLLEFIQKEYSLE